MKITLSLTCIVLVSALVGAPTIQAAEEVAPLHIYAAGSTQGALTAIAHDYTQATGQKIALTFGPAGMLRERIETEGGADVYVSANMAHPQRLADEGKGTPPVVFAKNRLCVTGRAELNLTSETLLDTLLTKPDLKIGTSTPKADPGGDYAWQFFDKAETLHPGAKALLESKAHQLFGSPSSPKVPAGENPMSYFMARHDADAFIGYCSSHEKLADAVTKPNDPPVTKVEVPASLAFPIGYGLTVLTNGSDTARHEAAYRFALYLMSTAAQKLLPDYGFLPGGTVWTP
jgi:ABC-type molybdate transport system substrate-binding protein